MKKFKKILCFVLPIVLVITAIFGVCITTDIFDRKNSGSNDPVVGVNSQVDAASGDTGASTAPQSEKGGAIYVGSGSKLDFDGTIKGSSNVYGGAIFLESGATFTMSSGEITGCSATYGGGIYVSAGATCTITGGTIKNCTAKFGAAIYVEKDAIFSCTSPGVNEYEIYNSNIKLGIVPEQVTVKKGGEVMQSGDSLAIGDVLDIQYGIKDDYFMDMKVTGADWQPESKTFVVTSSVEIEYIEKPATLDNLIFPSDSYGNCAQPNENYVPEGEVVIPNYHGGVMIDTICSQIGYGTMPGFDAYGKKITSIYIPGTVQNIYDHAFRDCTNLQSVVIGFGVPSLPNEVFMSCGSLTSIDISNSVTAIGDSAFRDCSLTDIIIPNGVTTIGNNAFRGCSFTDINIPDSVESVGDYAFYVNCSINVKIGAGLKRIGNNAFNALNSVVIDARNETITSRDNSGKECNVIIDKTTHTLLKGCNISTIPDDGSVTTIGESAFEGCTFYSDFIIPDSVKTIGEGAFADIQFADWENTLYMNAVVEIGAYAFYGVTLVSLTLPNTLEIIESNAFVGAVFENLNLGFGPMYIRRGAFDSSYIERLTLSGNIRLIEEGAFINCDIRSVFVYGTKSTWQYLYESFGNGNEYLFECEDVSFDG